MQNKKQTSKICTSCKRDYALPKSKQRPLDQYPQNITLPPKPNEEVKKEDDSEVSIPLLKDPSKQDGERQDLYSQTQKVNNQTDKFEESNKVLQELMAKRQKQLDHSKPQVSMMGESEDSKLNSQDRTSKYEVETQPQVRQPVSSINTPAPPVHEVIQTQPKSQEFQERTTGVKEELSNKLEYLQKKLEREMDLESINRLCATISNITKLLRDLC